MTTKKSPSHIFLIPFRDRETELGIWYNNMKSYLDIQIGSDNYEVLVIHQCDNRMFNKGAMCNTGFLYSKQLYPDTYKSIKFIIHDVDIYPVKVEGKKDIIKYETAIGEVNHPYGVLRSHLGGVLGGIVIILGEDYERVNGMPNYFGWGGEDVALSRRCRAHKLYINEDNFIDRRTNCLIVDAESHVTDAKKKVIAATDKLNLRKALRENSFNTNNGLNNLQFSIEEKNKINNTQNWIMINVNFNIN